MIIVRCQYCNRDYKTRDCWIKRNKYHCCSRKCIDNLKTKLSAKLCPVCKTQFNGSNVGRKKYCSSVCFNKSSIRRVKLYCNTCGKEYTVNNCRRNISRFCSRKCLRVYTGYLASQRTGIKNSNWKGYKDIKKNKSKFRKWSNEVKLRDNYICQDCFKTNCKLHAHHLISVREKPDLKFEVSNGITLCLECHAIRHQYDKVKVTQLILNKNGQVDSKN